MQKRIAASLLFLAFCFAFSPRLVAAETWYVRADGGTRYSANQPLGQCNGLADAAYPGTGVNQACAFNDLRYLWDDQSYGNSAWVIAGGDTVIVDNTQQWRVGFDGNGSSTDRWCFGGNGPYSCFNPTIPAGTASQHTRILGRNYASCNAGNAPDPSKMTQIFGGHGVYTALNLKGAQYVDVECIEITRHSQCITHGSPAYPGPCNVSVPIDDFDSDGVQTDVNTHDLLLQDMWIHGHTDRGIIGPIGGTVTANRVLINYNGMAGWDFDDGNHTASVNGSFIFNDSTIEWNGCNQEYPIVDTFPAISCYDDQSGGYGDGIGTPAGMGLNVTIEHSVFRYNTQDGEDFGHIDTGSSTLNLTDSESYGNMGGQFKWGPGFTSVTFENNLANANCLRMSEPITGAPGTYNSYLSDFCRADDALSFNFVNGAAALFANNTIVTYAPTTFDMQCVDSSCAATVFTLTNNIVRGYDNSGTYSLGGQAGGPGGYCGAGCNGSTQPIGTINRSHNAYFGMRNCPAGVAAGSSGGTLTDETCDDPEFVDEPAAFVDEATLDSFNFALDSGSPAIDAGVAVSGLTTDYDGNSRPATPSLGAIEYVAATVAPSLSFTAIANPAWGAAPFAVTTTSNSPGAVTYAVTSGPATISGSTVTLTGAGTVILTATQAASGNYSAATASTSFTVEQATPTLSFVSIAAQSYGAAPFTVSVTSNSTGAVTYAVASGPANISGATVTLTGAGTVMLTATQAATANYTAATASTSFTVGAETPALSFAAISGKVFGAAPFTVSATSASSGSVSYSVISGPATVSGSTVTLTGAGTVVLNASQAASGVYSAATASASFTVSPATPTLAFAAIPNPVYGRNPFTVSAASASPGAVTYAVASGPAVVSGNTVTPLGMGIVVLTATQAATANYTSATATASFTVAPIRRILSFTAIGNLTYGSAPFAVSTQPDSGGTVTYSVQSGPAVVSGNTVTLTGAGTVVLSASEAASGDYAAASATTSFLVSPATPTLSLPNLGTQTYGEPPFALSVASPSPGAVSYSVASGPATISGSLVTLTGVGQVTLIVTQQATANYTAAITTATFAVGAPSFRLSPAIGPDATITTAPGSMTSFTLTVSPVSPGIFPDAVNLAVTGLPTGATASFSPSAIAAGSGATTVTCTILTATQSARADQPWRPAPLLPVVLGLLVPVIGVRGARPRLLGRVPPVVRAVMLLGFALTLSACGSGVTVPASAGHSYPLVVTATDTVTGVASTASVTLSIQ